MKNSLNLCFVCLLFVVLACSCPSKLKEMANKDDSRTPRPTPSTTSSPETTPLTKGEYDLSMEKFNKIKVGMARSEVENTLGGKGTEISSSQGGKMKFSVNKWEGDRYQSIILSFKDDKVMTKSQVGLK